MDTVTANEIFTSAQITSLTTAMNQAITNIINVFVQVAPIMAAIAGVGFGIALVRGLFRRISNGD